MTLNLDLTAAPEAVTMRDIIQVCRNELLTISMLGHFSPTIVESAENPSFDEYLSEQPTAAIVEEQDNWAFPLYGLTKGDMFDSLKQWAKDTSKFYNGDKLMELVSDAASEWFELGRLAANPAEVIAHGAATFNQTL